MPHMVKPAPGYRVLFAEIPEVLWQKMLEESEGTGEPVNKMLARILAKHYRVAVKDLPKPKRMGRPPKKSP